jgi:citrate synthase
MATIERTAPIDVPRGLKGVIVTDTSVGDVHGAEGFYHYRGFSAVELAENRSFEDVWHLMFHGSLPDAARRAAFTAETAALRHLPAEVRGHCPRSPAPPRRPDPSRACGPRCRWPGRPPGSARCTTWAPGAGWPTRWPHAPSYRPC